MLHRRIAFLFAFAASIGLAACQGSVSTSGENGTGGEGGAGGSTTTSTSTTVVDCKTPAQPAAFEIGTGEKCFARVADGDEVPLMNGPQGGYHLWLAVGCDDCSAPVHLKFGARDPATNMPLAGTYDEEQMVPLSAVDWPQKAGLIVQMPGLSWDPEGQPPPAKGTHVLLWSDAYDDGGAVVHHAEVEVIIGDVQEWDPCIDDPNNPLCQTG